MSKRIASLVFALAALPTAAAAAQPAAAEPETASAETPPEPEAKTKWEFATIGYVWAAGAWGETDVIGPVEPVDLDLPFGKVLDAFKFAFVGSAEAKARLTPPYAPTASSLPVRRNSNRGTSRLTTPQEQVGR